jgi:alkylation response protein AidB-like acyl-CoA dehydrogenase
MDYELTEKEKAYKEKFLQWLDENDPCDHRRHENLPPESWEEQEAIYRAFQKKLYDAGYAGIIYPKEFGGQGLGVMENIIVTEALGAWNLVGIGNVNVVGHGMAAPTINACGTDQMKKEFLPKIFNGDHIWCQGFSEPNVGSDIGNVATKGIKDGDSYIINGQKIWTTYAHVADYCLLLARTDPNAKKHKGLSYFIVDMTLPGIEVQPVKQMSGETEFNEVFFDNVRVPEEMLVGGAGKGWQIMLTTLMFERVIGDVSYVSTLLWEYEGILEMAKRVKKEGKIASKDPIIRQKLAQLYIELMVTRYTGYRSVSKIASGKIPGPEGSVGKLMWSEGAKKLNELALEIQGPYHQLVHGSPAAIDQGRWQREFYYSKCFSMAGGTTEIQRNIIGERVLGLPR